MHEFHVHFFSTSQTVPIHEQIDKVKHAVEATHISPMRVYDAVLGRTVRIRLALLTFAGDNPMASEVTHHVSGRGNFPCRKCLVGGNQAHKESVGYNSLFEAGNARSLQQTRVAVMRDAVAVACQSSPNALQKFAREAGIKSRFPRATISSLLAKGDTLSHLEPKDKQALSHLEPKDKQGVLADHVRNNSSTILPSSLNIRGFNPMADTPIEILHTVLLGYVKYVWLDTYESLSTSKKLDIFITRLQSSEMSGLNLPPLQPSYIKRYGKSLTGSHFRQLIQVGVFHLVGLLENGLFQLWKDAAKLTGLIWFTEIVDLDDYCSMLNAQVAHVLDRFASRQPRKIIAKEKLHLLVHLADDVKRFGPLVGVSTERFESLNAVFQSSSIHSNRPNPSRDIAWDQIGIEWIKYLGSGGVLQTSGIRSQPGHDLKQLLCTNLVRNTFSFNKNMYERPVAGSHSIQDGGQRIDASLTKAAQATNEKNFRAIFEQPVARCSFVISRNLDRCTKGSFIFFETNFTNTASRIDELLLSAKNALAVVSILKLDENVNDTFQLPQLTDTGLCTLVPTRNILFDFNMQRSRATGVWLINLFSFHNIEPLYQSLPHELVRPKNINEADRRELHRQLAQRIQVSIPPSHKRQRSPSATSIP